MEERPEKGSAAGADEAWFRNRVSWLSFFFSLLVVWVHSPNVDLITGHWGELVPYYFDRIDEMIPEATTGLDRPFSEIYREHVYITPSGIASRNSAMPAINGMGADHVLWSHDFPYVKRDNVRDFLMDLPISQEEKEKVAYKNAETLLGL